jgi:hypothetical protein
MSKMNLILQKGEYQLSELIEKIAVQNPNLVVMEFSYSCGDENENTFHIIGSNDDVTLLELIRGKLSQEELKSLVYDEGQRRLIWDHSVIMCSYTSKVFYNVPSGIASELLAK